MGNLLQWPVRVPGRPYLWVLDTETESPAPTCVAHKVRTDGLGVCELCVIDWRATLGADLSVSPRCVVCQFPLHPAIELDGFDSCPTCSDTAHGVGARRDLAR